MKKLILFFLGILVCIICFFATQQIARSDDQGFIKDLLAKANITVNGNGSCNIQVHNDKLYSAIINKGSLGLGEAYMDGWWDSASLDNLFFCVARSDIYNWVPKNINAFFIYLKAKLMNLQSAVRAFQVGEQHYDLGNDLFKAMLDKNMLYSCGYWKNADTLDKAQEDKCDLICKKMSLKPGMRVLDIGCGWGGFALHAAKNYGVEVVGVTISKEQAEYARQVTKGYPVEIRLQDYRDIDEPFDRIISIGMFEHVGVKNYETFMRCVCKLLKDDGLVLLHTIGGNSSQVHGDPWLNKYIFVNGMLPSIEQIAQASQGLLIMEDWHNFGADYDKTLMAWDANFEKNWPQLKSSYDDRFYRMWKYYLLSCAGLFRARAIQLWQIVFSKSGILGGCQSVR
jgi:cyclopropane-fatty-acyl-phospholipid synthase